MSTQSDNSPVVQPTKPNTTSRRSLVFWSLILGAILLAGSVFAFKTLASLKKPLARREVDKKVYNVDVFVTEQVNLEEFVYGFGTARCDREVILAAQVSGEIVEVHPKLKVGHAVSDGADKRTADGRTPEDNKGDLLTRIDPRPFQERLIQAKNRLEEIDAEIVQTKQQIKNNQQLLRKAQDDTRSIEKEYQRTLRSREKGVASASEVTRSLLELQKYRDSVLQYETQSTLLPLQVDSAGKRRETLVNDLKLAELQLAKTEIRPRFSGQLSDVMVELGQYVNAGEPIARVSDLNVVEVAVPLALSDYAKVEAQIRDGSQPVVQLASNETASPAWEGRLVRVSPEADEMTRTVKVFVEVDNREQETPLLPGTFVNVRIGGVKYNNVIPIPRDTIRKGRVLIAKPDGQAESVDVRISGTLHLMALVEDSLQPGQQIILTNVDSIPTAARVEVQRKRDLASELQAQRTNLIRIVD